MLFILLLFSNLLAYGVFSTPAIRVHHGDVLKLKCEALPMRSVYSEGTCYYSYVEKFPLSDAAKTCQKIFTEATVVTERTPVIEQFLAKYEDFHGSDETGDLKRVLCAYESGAKCEEDETLLANALCVHVDEDRNYNDGLNYCRSRKSSLPIIGNFEQNQLLAGTLSLQGVSGGWLLQRTAKSKSGMGFTYPESDQSMRYFAQLDGSSGICKSEEGMIIQQLANKCSTFGTWRFNDLKKLNTTICVRPADSDFSPVGPELPEPEVTRKDESATKPNVPALTEKPVTNAPALTDKPPSSDILVPLKYFYNAFHIRHAFCTNAACMHYTNKKDVGFSPTFKQASSLGRIITHLPKGMQKMAQLCPKGAPKLKHLFFRKESGRYVADFKSGHTDAGWVAVEKGVCGATVPIKEYSCRMSKDFMYGQNLEWNTFYKGLARHKGKPVFYIWK